MLIASIIASRSVSPAARFASIVANNPVGSVSSILVFGSSTAAPGVPKNPDIDVISGITVSLIVVITVFISVSRSNTPPYKPVPPTISSVGFPSSSTPYSGTPTISSIIPGIASMATPWLNNVLYKPVGSLSSISVFGSSTSAPGEPTYSTRVLTSPCISVTCPGTSPRRLSI